MIYDNNKRLEFRKKFNEGVKIGLYIYSNSCRVCSCDVRYIKNKRCVSCKHRMDAGLYLNRKNKKKELRVMNANFSSLDKGY